MELEKVKIHRIQQNGTAVSQITLDDDYNVPDYRPDIMKVLKENGERRFTGSQEETIFALLKEKLPDLTMEEVFPVELE